MIVKLLRFFKHNFIYFLPIILLLIFALSIWDKNYYFGGDSIFPIVPQDNIIKSFFLWDMLNGGVSFFRYMFLVWQAFFYFLSFAHVPSFISIKIFILTLNVVGFVFTYLLYKTLFKETTFGKNQWALLAGLLFILNPVGLLVLMGATPLYCFPACLFFLVKFLDTKKILYAIPFAFFINLGFFPDFPQAKLFVVFIFACGFLLLVYVHLRKIPLHILIIRLVILGILTFLLNAMFLVPFINDSFFNGSFQKLTSSVPNYNGDADLFYAALPYISRFYNSNLANNNPPLMDALTSTFFTIWTFLGVLLGIISVFFAKEKKEKQLIYILLTAYVFFVFLAKGANPPFGEVYKWLLYHVSFFKLFRTTSSAIIGAVIFYVFLVTYSVHNITRKHFSLLVVFIIIQICIFYPIYSSYKMNALLGGDIYQKGISIPNAYFVLGKLLDSYPIDGRVLVLPINDGYVTTTWKYVGQSLIPWVTKKPVLSTNIPISENFGSMSSSEFCLLSSLYNISNYVKEKTALVSGGIKKQIEFPGEIMLSNQYFDLLKTYPKCYTSTVYIPQNIVYFHGNQAHATELALLPQVITKDSIVTDNNELLPQEQGEANKSASKQEVNEALLPMNDVSLPPGSFKRLFLGGDQLITDVYYPQPQVRPDSPLYEYILFKEKIAENKKGISYRQRLDKELELASKRISEIYTWGINNTWWKSSLDNYKQKMTSAIQLATNGDHPRDDLDLVFEYLQKHEDRITSLINQTPYWDREKVTAWNGVFDSLEKSSRTAYTFPQQNNFLYDLTVSATAQYDILVGIPDSLLNTDLQTLFMVNNVNLLSQNRTFPINHDFSRIVTTTLKKGLNRLSLKVPNSLPNMLTQSNWEIITNGVTIGSASATTNNSSQIKIQNSKVGDGFSQDVPKWQAGQLYILNLKYIPIDDGRITVAVTEKSKIYDVAREEWVEKSNNILKDQPNPKFDQGNYVVLIRAGNNATHATISISGAHGDTIVADAELKKFIMPRIYAVSTTQIDKDKDNSQNPSIAKLTKINPTKYIASISNVHNPFILVLSESYSSGWKAYWRKEQNNSGIISSLFEQHRDIPENQHRLVNGYANAWYITPPENKGNDRYTLVIEYMPQRIFYMGICISLITLLGCFLYAMITLRKK